MKKLLLFVSALAIVLAACVPAPSSVPGAQSPLASPAAAPKVMTLGVNRLLNTLQRRIVGAVAGAGEPQIWNIAHEHLYAEAGDDLYPRLAELPSVDRGTWRINVDGSMDTIWKI